MKEMCSLYGAFFSSRQVDRLREEVAVHLPARKSILFHRDYSGTIMFHLDEEIGRVPHTPLPFSIAITPRHPHAVFPRFPFHVNLPSRLIRSISTVCVSKRALERLAVVSSLSRVRRVNPHAAP